jgi:hypothetical protein
MNTIEESITSMSLDRDGLSIDNIAFTFINSAGKINCFDYDGRHFLAKVHVNTKEDSRSIYLLNESKTYNNMGIGRFPLINGNDRQIAVIISGVAEIGEERSLFSWIVNEQPERYKNRPISIVLVEIDSCYYIDDDIKFLKFLEDYMVENIGINWAKIVDDGYTSVYWKEHFNDSTYFLEGSGGYVLAPFNKKGDPAIYTILLDHEKREEFIKNVLDSSDIYAHVDPENII